MLKNKDDIKAWLDKYKINNYTINDDLTVDVKGSVDLYGKSLSSIPVQFGTVTNSFDCGDNELTTFKGCPKKVGKIFIGVDNNVTSLENGPEEIGHDYYISNNPLVNLQHGPKKIGGDFLCRQVPLKNLHDINSEFEGKLFYCGSIIEDFSQYYTSTSLDISYQEFKAIKQFIELNKKVPHKDNNDIQSSKRKI